MSEHANLPGAGTYRVADSGVALVKSLVSSDRISGGLGCFFRELPTADVGIDGQIEIVTGHPSQEGLATGRIVSVQIKTGPSYFTKGDATHWFYYADKRTMNYWVAHSLPVLIVLVDTRGNCCYWTRADSEGHEEKDASFLIRVPKNSLLNSTAYDAIAHIAENTTEAGRRLATLQHDLSYMRALEEGEKLSVDLGHWWNKSSGRTEVTIGRSRPGQAPSGLEVLEKFTIFAGGGERSVVERVFPWATAQVDSEFLETMEDEWYDNYLCDTGMYDAESGIYFDINDSFDSSCYYNNDCPAAYSESSGEVGFYRYSITLNDLGRSFLRVAAFMEAAASSPSSS